MFYSILLTVQFSTVMNCQTIELSNGHRCGKSVILSQIADELRAQGKQVLTVNFELIEYSSLISDALSLTEYAKARIPCPGCIFRCGRKHL